MTVFDSRALPLESLTSLKDLDVKGFGDIEMVRDINYDGIDFDDYEKLDFFGKVQGNDTLTQTQNVGGAFVLSGQQPPDFQNLSLNEFDKVIEFIKILNFLAEHKNYHLLSSLGFVNSFNKAEVKNLDKI